MSGSIFQAATERSVGERDGRIAVTFLRTGDLTGSATVTYGVTAESATVGADFTGGTGTATFAPGQTQLSIFIDIVNDTASEATETFIVTLESVTSGSLSLPRTCRINILDDENPVLPPADPPLVSQYATLSQTLFTGLAQPINMEFSPVDPARVYVAEKGGVIRMFNTQTGQNLGVFLDLSAQVCNNEDRGLIDIVFHPDFANNPYFYAFYVADPPDVSRQDWYGNRYAHVVRYTVDASTNYSSVVPGSGVVLVGGAGTSVIDISGGGNQDFTDQAFAGLTSSERFVSGSDPTPPVVVSGVKQNYIKVDSVTHAGGGLAFGPDGMLYISTGDGTSPSFPDTRTADVQNLNSLSGKILRVDPLTGRGLADNPFYTAGQSLDANINKVWQYGLRNPFSIAFDNVGRLFITDTGWNAYEEINNGLAGANFGWPWYEGRDSGLLAQTSGYSSLAAAQTFYQNVANGTILVTPPYAAFGHATSAPGFQNQVITGGAVIYDGDKYPAELQGDYFFTNFAFGRVFTIDTDNRQQINFLYTATSEFAPVHFVQGADGYVYFANLGSRSGGFTDGSIGRLLIAPASGQLVTLSAPTQVTEGVTPSVTVTFSLSSAQAAPVTVTYSTLNGTAIPGLDYTGATNATVVIPAGQTSVQVAIPLINDAVNEPNETFVITLNGATRDGAPVAAGGAVEVTVQDNDGPPPSLLVNGSLEQPPVAVNQFASFASIPGWTAIAGGTIELWNAHNGVVGTNGANFAELDFAGARDGFFQDVQTVAGQTYALSFDLRGRPGAALSTMGVEVVWNGAVVGVTTPTSTASWNGYTVNVTGTGGADRLTIREVLAQGSDGLGALLDNFRLVSAGPPTPSVTVAASPAQVTEGPAAAANVVFTLSSAQAAPVIVTYSTANGTAIAGADFTGATSATVTIPAGQTSVSVQIPVTDDVTAEVTETFSVVLNGATQNGAALLASGSATVSILDNEPPPPSVSVAATPATVGEGAGSASIVFSLSAPQSAPVVVTYSTVNGTAVAGADFTGAANATATIPVGQTSVTVSVPVINDAANEPTETFSVTLVGATLNGAAIPAAGTATVTITDNDAPPPNLLVNGSLEQSTVAAGGWASFASIPGWTAITGGSIELWNGHNGVVATDGVKFAELDFAGARDGFFQDVQTAAGQAYTLAFDLRGRSGAPLSSQSVEVVWNGAVVATTAPASTASWGTFTVNVTGTGGADRLTIREVQAQSADGLGALLDNFRLAAAGPPQPAVSVAATPATVTEGAGVSATVTFTLSAAQAAPVTVTYSTVDGTAQAPGDFTAATAATAQIPAGQTSVSVTIPLTNDGTNEPTETFAVRLEGATLGGQSIAASGSATITLADDDPAPPTVSIAATPTQVTEGVSTAATVVFTLNAAQATPVVVTYSTANGTALAAQDFTGATNATATIPAGQTSVSVTVPILNDTVSEPTETFTVQLVGATLGGTPIAASGSATVTILDNDAPAGTNLLVNGSFESATVATGQWAQFSSIPGWTAITGGRIEVWNAHNGVTASNGTKHLELDFATARDGLFQDVQTAAGESYTLTFDLRLRSGVAASSQGVEVVWNGAVIATTTPASSTSWNSFSATVTGTGGLDRLTIREVSTQGGDGLGALLDNFRLIAATAAPTAAALMTAEATSATAPSLLVATTTDGGSTATPPPAGGRAPSLSAFDGFHDLIGAGPDFPLSSDDILRPHTYDYLFGA